jgi:hypothetical protein
LIATASAHLIRRDRGSPPPPVGFRRTVCRPLPRDLRRRRNDDDDDDNKDGRRWTKTTIDERMATVSSTIDTVAKRQI